MNRLLRFLLLLPQIYRTLSAMVKALEDGKADAIERAQCSKPMWDVAEKVAKVIRE